MLTDELLAGDTREPGERGTFIHYGGEIGELWLHRRENGGYELLSADPVVVVTREFLHRLTGTDARLVNAEGWPQHITVGSTMTFYGYDRTVRYKVLRAGPTHMMWLLERQHVVALR